MGNGIYFSDLAHFFRRKSRKLTGAFFCLSAAAFLAFPGERTVEKQWTPDRFSRCFIELNTQMNLVKQEKGELEKVLLRVSEQAFFPRPIVDMRRNDRLMQTFAIKDEVVHRIAKADEVLETIPKKWITNHFFKGVPQTSIKHPKLSRYFRLAIALLSGLVGAGVYFAIMVQRQSSRKGLPVSSETLKKLGHNVIGDLDLSLSETLQTEVASFATDLLHQGIDLSKPILGVIGPVDSHPPTLIAELFARENRSVLLIDLTYRDAQDLTPGLWQYLHNEIVECPIAKREGYDFLPLGKWRGSDRNVTGKLPFERLLKEQGKKYNHIILFAAVPVTSPQGIAIQNWCDGAVLSLEAESLQQLAACPALAEGKVSFFTKGSD